jgi:hypothetical protein
MYMYLCKHIYIYMYRVSGEQSVVANMQTTIDGLQSTVMTDKGMIINMQSTIEGLENDVTSLQVCIHI